MKTSIDKLISKSMRWNAAEAIAYQLLMCFHQSALFIHLDSYLYGSSGILFSGIYLTVTLANIGLDASLGSWWHHALTSRSAFKTCVLLNLIPQLILSVPIMMGFIYYFIPSLTAPMIITVALLALIESIKKTLKLCLYLRFSNQITASTEVVLLFCYVGMVWTSIRYWDDCTLSMLFLPMMLTSTIAIIQYATYIIRLYITLPDNDTPIISITSLTATRITNYANQITHLLFSGNLLIPLFATRFGVPTAAVLKFVYTIAYSIGTIMHKAIGTTSQALFAYAKSTDFAVSKAIFATCTNYMYQLIYVTSIVYIINSSKVQTADLNSIAIFVFGSIIISENICNIYEHFLITHDKGYYSTVTQLISFVVAYIVMWSISASLVITLIMLLSIRIATIMVLEYIVRYHWAIHSQTNLRPWYGIGGLVIALFALWIL